MAPSHTSVNDVEKDDMVIPDAGEDPEHSSSSEFVPSASESNDSSDDEPPRRRRLRRTNPHRQTHASLQIRAVEPTPEDDSSDASKSDKEDTEQHHARDSSPHSNARDRFRHGCRCGEVRVIPEEWGSRSLVNGDFREVFERKIFGKEHPRLAQLNIPRARCEVIMAAGEGRAKKEESLESSKVKPMESLDTALTSLQREDSAPTAFRFTDLPLEVQLMILKYCLTTEAPLVDFCLGYLFPPSEYATRERSGQHDSSLAMLATNRLFREQGLQILWQHNRFLYTRSDEFTLLNTDILMKSSQIAFLRHLTIHQDSIWQPRAFYHRVMLDSILFAVSATEHFPALQTLELDLETTTVIPYCHERGKWLRATLLEVKYFLRDLEGGRSLRRLKRVSVTGVSDDDFGCLAVKLASFLVAPDGRLGVKLADLRKERRWSDSLWLFVQGDSDTMWMTLDDVDVWVKWQRETHGNTPKLLEWEKYFPV